MDNQPWDKAKLEEWEKFWNSEMGQEALKKMKIIKEQFMNEALKQGDPNMVAAYVGRAAGIEMVLQDIEAGFDALKQVKEKEDEKEAKK